MTIRIRGLDRSYRVIPARKVRSPLLLLARPSLPVTLAWRSPVPLWHPFETAEALA